MVQSFKFWLAKEAAEFAVGFALFCFVVAVVVIVEWRARRGRNG